MLTEQAQAPVTVVTGCDSGIGRALASEFHRRGHQVYATGLNLETLADLKDRGLRTAVLDVTNPESIEAFASRLVSDDVTPDYLVNNAGFGAMGPTLEMPMKDVRAQYEVNVFGALAVTQALVPAMIERGSGVIVNIGSTSGVMTTPFAGVYCSTKAAIHALSDALRMELAPFNLQVVRVEPNQIRTNFGEAAAAALARRFENGSRYAAVKDDAIGRAKASQHASSMPAPEFAKRVVDGVTATTPPIRLRVGRELWPYTVFKPFLPSRKMDTILSRKFHLERVAAQ